MTHTQPPDPAAPPVIPLAVARDLGQVLAAFEVYRSGAQFALGCRVCPGRRGSWRHLGLAELVAIAERHYRDHHDGDEQAGGAE